MPPLTLKQHVMMYWICTDELLEQILILVKLSITWAKRAKKMTFEASKYTYLSLVFYSNKKLFVARFICHCKFVVRYINVVGENMISFFIIWYIIIIVAW